MIDYLLAFQDEASAHEVLASFGLSTPDGWDTSRVMAPIRVTMLDGTTPAGFWIGATLKDRDPALDAIAQAILDPARQEGLSPSAYVITSVWPTANIDAIAEISPLWTGRPYRFPGLWG